MTANDRQVGGDHYKSEYQHWDWVEDCNIPYLEGCATKYVMRAFKKNGVQDLDKAIHYVEKIKERRAGTLIRVGFNYTHETLNFCASNEMTYEQTLTILRIVSWETPEQLDIAIQYIEKIKNDAIKATA